MMRQNPRIQGQDRVVSSSLMNEGPKRRTPTHHSTVERHFTLSLADNVDIISGIPSREMYS